jgi:diacylglycerol kinase
MLDDDSPNTEPSWGRKFRDAFRGVKTGVRGQSSFFVHFFAAAVVLAAGVVLRVAFIEWCLLWLCITAVLTSEMFNSAIESMAKAVSDKHHPHLGNSLDISAGAVLIASIGASIVGLIIFTRQIGKLVGWW